MQIKKMKAAILVASHQPLVVDEVELPEKLDFGQVLVKVHYSGICASQIHEIEATKGPDQYLPHLLGHEGSATVLEVGAGVKTVKPDDRVVMHWRQGSGIQAEPASYAWGGQRVNSGWVTTFNEFAVVSENRLTVIPQDYNLKVAPLYGCAVTTGFGVINNDAQVKIGQSVIVLGVGGIGLSIVLGAKLASAYPIVAVDVVDHKLDMARRFGATHVLNSKKTDDLVSDLLKIIGPQGADVVAETTGNVRIIEQAYDLSHRVGKTILVGVPRKGNNASIYTLPLHFNKVLKGSHGGSATPDVDIPNYIRLERSNQFSLDSMITHEFSLDEVNQAIEAVKEGHTGRVILDMKLA